MGDVQHFLASAHGPRSALLTLPLRHANFKPVGALSQYDKGLNREHGEAYPKGTKTVAAPATVSGEGGSQNHWETGKGDPLGQK